LRIIPLIMVMGFQFFLLFHPLPELLDLIRIEINNGMLVFHSFDSLDLKHFLRYP
jgi:hypothetical protein